MQAPPPQPTIVKEKDYKAKYAEYDQQPCIVVKNNSCKDSVNLIGEDDIIGLNELGTKAILNGAVCPTTSWLKYVFESDGPQVVDYTEKYPIQSDLLAQIQDLLLKESLKMVVSFDKLKAAIVLVSPKVKFLDKLKLPTIRIDPPVFTADLVQKYIWAVKKMNIENLDELLGALDREGDSIDCSKEFKLVTEVYDYSNTTSAAPAPTPQAAPATPQAAAPAPAPAPAPEVASEVGPKPPGLLKKLTRKLNIRIPKIKSFVKNINISDYNEKALTYISNFNKGEFKDELGTKLNSIILEFMRNLQNPEIPEQQWTNSAENKQLKERVESAGYFGPKQRHVSASKVFYVDKSTGKQIPKARIFFDTNWQPFQNLLSYIAFMEGNALEFTKESKFYITTLKSALEEMGKN
jgi:hypothetical protein